MKNPSMPKKFGEQQIAATSRRDPESIFLKVERGTLARIDDVLENFEPRSHMLREAIEREVKRRERQQR
jgi:hypothetical protein